MKQSYTRLAIEEREKIAYYIKEGKLSITEVAKLLKRHKSTISRELKSHSLNQIYDPYKAHEQYRSDLKRNKHKLSNPLILDYVITKLKIDRWSPEQIAKRAAKDKLFKISHQIIYEFIYNPKNKHLELFKYLRHKSKRMNAYKRKAGALKCKIPNLVKISQRPIEVDKRKSLGDFEGDLIILNVAKRMQILTLIERKSRYVMLFLLKSKSASCVVNKINFALQNLPFKPKTITFDRGAEFAHHEQLPVAAYFCNPGQPWQKGSVENMNGRVRWLLPKNAGHRPITQSMLDEIEQKINNAPLKVLKYKTPSEIFYQ